MGRPMLLLPRLSLGHIESVTPFTPFLLLLLLLLLLLRSETGLTLRYCARQPRKTAAATSQEENGGCEDNQRGFPMADCTAVARGHSKK
jgi:hypothetical protein